MKQKGFTLIEVLVGLAVFSLAITIAVNLFAAALKAQRKSIALQNVQDNGRYLMGFMAKEIRMAEISTFDGETMILDIVHPVNGNVRYSFSGGQIIRQDVSATGPINSDEVRAEGRFFIDGKTAGDYEQPRVTVVMKIEAIGAKPEQQAKIDLQVTLTQRNLD